MVMKYVKIAVLENANLIINELGLFLYSFIYKNGVSFHWLTLRVRGIRACFFSLNYL